MQTRPTDTRVPADHEGASSADHDGAPSDELASAKGLEAYEVLQRGIHMGEYPSGSRLKEVELAAELGMSRTPVREAIRRLEREGLVEVIPNRGAAVRSWSADDIDDAYALRAVLEGFSASRAAVRMDAAGLAHLEQVNDELETRVREASDDTNSLIRLNGAFHRAIMAASQNNRIADVLPQATEAPMAMKQAFWRSARAREFAVVYHREIIESLRARDAVRAEAVMRSHVFAVKDFFTQHQRDARLRNLLAE